MTHIVGQLSIVAGPSDSNASVYDPVQRLRNATHDLHQRLDLNLALSSVKPSLTDYRNHISVLSKWQIALKPWLSLVSDNEWSLALIAQDLADFPDNDSATAKIPSPVNLVHLHQKDDGSSAFCWGIFYVLAGSRLGGEVLYRRLSELLAPHPLRYLSNSHKGGCSWGNTLIALRKNLATKQAQISAVNGAVAAFELLIAQFQLAGMLTRPMQIQQPLTSPRVMPPENLYDK